MPEHERLRLVALEWIAKAENDLKTAAHTLKLGLDCPTDTVCFHAQQCVEKYIKAALVAAGIDFPKTHDIEELIAQLPTHIELRITVEEQRRLTRCATGTRYPGWDEIPLAEARRVVALARRVRREARTRLLREVLVRRGK